MKIILLILCLFINSFSFGQSRDKIVQSLKNGIFLDLEISAKAQKKVDSFRRVGLTPREEDLYDLIVYPASARNNLKQLHLVNVYGHCMVYESYFFTPKEKIRYRSLSRQIRDRNGVFYGG